MKLWLVMLLAASACGSVRSQDLKTAEVYAQLEANAPGNGRIDTRATLMLGPGSLTFLELAPDDVLTATVGQTTRAMSRKSAFGTTWYEAGFDDAPGTSVSISLSRPSDTSAPESVVTMPAPFEFTAPTANTTVPRAGGLILMWSGSGQPEPLRASVRGSCIQPVDTELARDSGSHTFAAFTAVSGAESSDCDVVITLVRTKTGTVDRAYGKGGVFKATVSRTLTLTSTP